ncbi:MAG: lipoate--protein ligase family protein [Actinobacteria bacterium]|nr:lipoate--protein ligase family protein [Actinomycetota bacterium]
MPSYAIGDKWRFIEDPGYSGSLNMARDAALALCMGDGSMPVLRVYRFTPACITIGRFQRINDGLDIKRCESAGVELARRPTGGMAILHKDDFTYSVTLPRMAGEEHPAGARDLYFDLIAGGILCSLELLGIHAQVVRHKENRKHSAWCFEGVAGIDIKYRGRKICGSAQKIYEKSVLQHGSLFLDLDRKLYMGLTGCDVKSPESRPLSFISLCEAGENEYSWNGISSAFEKGFSDALNIELINSEFTDRENIMTDRLFKERFGMESWNTGGVQERDRTFSDM